MSGTDEGDSLCEPCRGNMERVATLKISQLQQSVNGIFIADLGALYNSPRDSCKVCRLLHSMKIDADGHLASRFRASPESTGAEDRTFELRAFSFLCNYGGINYGKLVGNRNIGDAVNLGVLPAGFNLLRFRHALKPFFWRCGHLLCSTGSHSRRDLRSMAARIIPRQFDPSIVQSWLEYCDSHHADLCSDVVGMPGLEVIDCVSREILLAPSNALYVTLSYVWGQKIEVPLEDEVVRTATGSRRFLPRAIPKVVEDAIKVTMVLGFRYLWVDKYCIDQKSADKHVQIRRMDMIYSKSHLTIIQAVGEGESSGLPGVSTSQRRPQPVVDCGETKLISIMPHPHDKIKKSKWMTRGWTLQESILSRRRLVFTEDQLYFECNAMNCFEGLEAPLGLTHTNQRDKFRAFMRAGLFTGRDEGLDVPIFGEPFGGFDDRNSSWSYHIRKYLVLATNYTSRTLSFDSDSLNAFLGIVAHFEKSKYPILHLEGIPYVSPGIFIDGAVRLDSAVAGLCWRHVDCRWSGRPEVRRRVEFPSWTWAGWAGAVSWTDLFTSKTMDVQCLVDDFRCEFQDGTIIPLRDHNIEQRSVGNRKTRVLRFSAWLVPPEMISLHTSNSTPAWKIGSFELQLHISAFEGEPKDFLEALKDGRVECFYAGKGLYNSYFLFVKPQGVYATRIGTGEAVYFHDSRYYRFADETRFEASKIEIRLA